MTSIPKMCIDDIVNKYSNTYQHNQNKACWCSSIYIDSSKKNYDKDPKFKIGVNVRTSKSKSIFAKEYSPKYPEEVFVIKKNQNIVSWTCY